ncbi:MAG TPA: hypothetical protein PK358_07485 [Spirochaetota bacterium]|nr:hypothetical protein [Spirochaetota bacterium]
MKNIIIRFFILMFFVILLSPLYAENAGSRGSYTRGGWAGARYTAAGMTGEVLADDVFAIYWNPAGLSELKVKKKLTEAQIKEKAKSGDIDDITEEDLLNFSEGQYEKLFLNIGVSYSSLDIERDAGFTGLAFNAFKGVIGAGFFSITSGDIETRDETGTLTGSDRYTGSVGYLSYSIPWNIISFGISLKGYYESIGEYSYYGAGSDVGAQIYLLPFLKMGIMIRDAGGFLKPEKSEYSETEYDFFMPQIKIGAAFLSDTGIRVSFSGSRKLEQSNFEYGIGVEFDLNRYMMLSAGLCDGYFSTGVTLRAAGVDISYALNFDKIDYGYNNTVSAAVLF